MKCAIIVALASVVAVAIAGTLPAQPTQFYMKVTTDTMAGPLLYRELWVSGTQNREYLLDLLTYATAGKTYYDYYVDPAYGYKSLTIADGVVTACSNGSATWTPQVYGLPTDYNQWTNTATGVTCGTATCDVFFAQSLYPIAGLTMNYTAWYLTGTNTPVMFNLKNNMLASVGLAAGLTFNVVAWETSAPSAGNLTFPDPSPCPTPGSSSSVTGTGTNSGSGSSSSTPTTSTKGPLPTAPSDYYIQYDAAGYGTLRKVWKSPLRSHEWTYTPTPTLVATIEFWADTSISASKTKNVTTLYNPITQVTVGPTCSLNNYYYYPQVVGIPLDWNSWEKTTDAVPCGDTVEPSKMCDQFVCTSVVPMNFAGTDIYPVYTAYYLTGTNHPYKLDLDLSVAVVNMKVAVWDPTPQSLANLTYPIPGICGEYWPELPSSSSEETFRTSGSMTNSVASLLVMLLSLLPFF